MRFIAPTDEQIDALAMTLRATDRREVRASDGIGARVAVWRSWGNSAVRHGIAGDDGALVGVCGVCPDSGAGEIWLLGNDGLLATASHRRQFLRGGRLWVRELLTDWKLLHNWVFAANSQSVQWLRFLGFEVHPAEPHGPYAQLFRYFCRRAS